MIELLTELFCLILQPAGFSIEITKTTNTTVMVGVRVLVGSQSIDRAPTYLEVFGRTTAVSLTEVVFGYRGKCYLMPSITISYLIMAKS